jgi:hypothetical protein
VTGHAMHVHCCILTGMDTIVCVCAHQRTGLWGFGNNHGTMVTSSCSMLVHVGQALGSGSIATAHMN